MTTTEMTALPRASAEGQLPPHDVTDIGLARAGVTRIEWAEREMPVLRLIRERFENEKPLEGLRVGACLHVTTETANLMRTLKAAGAHVALCASNPLSTQDDVAAALVSEYGISVYARRGVDRDGYYRHLNAVVDTHPHLTQDDGCDLVSLLHRDRTDALGGVLAGTEETTTGIIRLRAMAADGALKYPVVGVNEAQHEASLRQPLWHRPVDGRRHPARHQRPAGRPPRGRRRIWLGGQGHCVAHARHGRPGGHRRGRSNRRDRSLHGGLPGHVRPGGGRMGRGLRHRDGQPPRLPRRALRADAQRRDPGQQRPLRRRAATWCALQRDGRRPRPRAAPGRPGVRPRRSRSSTCWPRAGSSTWPRPRDTRRQSWT